MNNFSVFFHFTGYNYTFLKNRMNQISIFFNLWLNINAVVISLFKPSYLPPLKFVEVVRVLQIALSGVSVFSININEDVGVGPGTQHVTSEDAHFIGVDCQTMQGDELLTPL